MDDKIDPEILREMRIVDEIEIPNESEFEAKFTEKEMQGYDHRDKDVLKAIKQLENMVKWIIRVAVQQNTQLRLMEAELIQRRRDFETAIKEMREDLKALQSINRVAKVGKALLMVAAGGAATKIGEYIFVKLWK